MSTVKLSKAQIDMLDKASKNLCLVFTNEVQKMSRGNILTALGYLYQKHVDDGALGGAPLIEFMINGAGLAYLAALEPVEPDAPTDDTLGDALYERAESVEGVVIVGERAEEVPCKTCGELFWSLDSDHTECRKCDEAAGQRRENFMTSIFGALIRNGAQEIQIAPIDPRIAQLEAELAQAKARISELEAAQGLFPKEVYAAYVASQDTHLSPVQDSYACMAIRDTMSDAIINRPDGYPIVQESHS